MIENDELNETIDISQVVLSEDDLTGDIKITDDMIIIRVEDNG